MDGTPETPPAWTAAAALGSVGKSAVLLLLGAGIVSGMLHTAKDVYLLANDAAGGGALSQWLAAVALVLATFGCAWLLATRRTALPPPLFLLGLVLATLLLRALLIGLVEPAWNTDYLRYWERAVEMVASGRLSVDNVYQQRALLVPYPVEWLFGPGATTALKWTNALLLLLVQLLAYDAVRLLHSHQAAQATSLVLLASPFPAYAALIPSHDLWALAFLATSMWTVCRAQYPPRGRVARTMFIVGLAALCALSTYFLELQRSTGTLLFAALLAAVLVHLLATRFASTRPRSPSGSSLILVAALAIVLYPAVQAGSAVLGIQPASTTGGQSSMAMKYAAHGSAMGTGRSAWYARFNDRFHAKALGAPDVARDFSRSVVLSTWSLQPQGKLDAMRDHAGRLFSLSYPFDWDTLLRRPEGMDSQTRSALIIHVGVFGLALLAASLASLVVLLARPGNIIFPVLQGTLFVLGLALVMLTLFENKPFNIAPVWLLYPLLFGVAAASTTARARQGEGRHAAVAAVLAACMLVGGGGAAWFALGFAYDVNDGQVLSRWDLQLSRLETSDEDWERQIGQLPPQAFEPRHYVRDRRSFVLRDAPEDAGRIQKRANQLYFVLQFPPGAVSRGDTLSASREVCLDGSRDVLEFFMFVPYTRPGVDRAFEIDVSLDGRSLRQFPIPHRDRSDTMQLASVSLPPVSRGPGCHTVGITLVSNVDRSALSWAQASRVEIWFPRLVRAAD